VFKPPNRESETTKPKALVNRKPAVTMELMVPAKLWMKNLSRVSL
jgi:hypothetical protein